MRHFENLSLLGASALLMAGSFAASAQINQQRRLVTQPINNAQMVMYRGNIRPEATSDNDLGLAVASTPFTGELVLQRPPETQAAYDQLTADLNNPASPKFHKWLTNAQIGTVYGPAPEDIAAVKSWLTSKGLTVGGVTPDGMVVEFSGTVGAAGAAFGAPIHKLSVNGVAHIGNMNDPSIPAALAGVVGGVAKLNDFMPHPLSQPRLNTKATAKGSKGVLNNGFISYLGAADLAAIYNFNPLFKAGITGKGQTIVVIEDTDQYSINDWSVFRKTFGLARAYPSGTLVNAHPTGSMTCGAPGVNGDDGEAAIDSEWATAAAPNAAIINAACADTRTQFGGFIALSNLLGEPNPPTVVSISYGESESENGAAENLFIKNLYQTAANMGVSIFVSSGDESAASSDANKTAATHGITVSGYSSTPYNISVGGTDFGYIPLGTPGTYFNSTNGPSFQSATGYISEIPWNDSCAGSILSAYEGLPNAGPTSICNDTADFGTSLRTTGSGSGGPSNCATGTATITGVASGTCAGYAKPSWQNILGVPADGVRDIPDVSLMASNGFWGTYYGVCWSDPVAIQEQAGAAVCGSDPGQWAGFGGTSVSSPIWAGIQALVNQATGKSWGNSNPVLYSLASAEYGNAGKASCNSSLGNAVGSDCVFYDVTQGDMAVNCLPDTSRNRQTGVVTIIGTFNCYIAPDPSNTVTTQGVLSTSNTDDLPAYGTNVGYDYATGIGTTNATNLVNAWKAYALAHPPI